MSENYLIQRWVNGGWIDMGIMFSELTAKYAVEGLNSFGKHWKYRYIKA